MTDPTAEAPPPDAGAGASGHRRFVMAGAFDAFDELRGTRQAADPLLAPPLAHWEGFFAALGPGTAAATSHELAARAARVQRRVREDGASYNVHAPGSDQS